MMGSKVNQSRQTKKMSSVWKETGLIGQVYFFFQFIFFIYLFIYLFIYFIYLHIHGLEAQKVKWSLTQVFLYGQRFITQKFLSRVFYKNSHIFVCFRVSLILRNIEEKQFWWKIWFWWNFCLFVCFVCLFVCFLLKSIWVGLEHLGRSVEYNFFFFFCLIAMSTDKYEQHEG